MNVSMLVKINFLILGLGLTLYFIYGLNSRGLNPGVKAVLGLPTKNQTNVQSWKWCSTRVASLIQPEKFKLTQEGNLWVRENGLRQVVDFIAVEKWLANACSVLVTPAKAVVDDAFAPTLMVKFIDGKVELVRRHPNGTYFWNGQTFTSPEFDAALAQLGALPVK